MLYAPNTIAVDEHEIIESEIETGRFQWLDIVMSRWAHLLEDTLYEQLHSVFEVETETVEWVRFGNFIKNVGNQPIYIFETENQGKGLLIVENRFAQACLDRNPETLAETHNLDLRQFNPEKQQELLSVLSSLIQDFEKSWEGIGNVRMQLKKITTHPLRAKVMLPFERCLLGKVSFRFPDFHSGLTICLPYASLHPLLSKLEQRKVLAPESMDHYHHEIEEHFKSLLHNHRYTISAQMGVVEIKSIGTNSPLYEGKVLPLNALNTGEVAICINHEPVMTGETGNSNGKFCVQVTGKFDEKKKSTQSTQKQFHAIKWPQ